MASNIELTQDEAAKMVSGIFTDAMGMASEKHKEGGRHQDAIRTRQMQNAWAEILALAKSGKLWA